MTRRRQCLALFVAFFTAIAQARELPSTLVISDIDDTLQMTLLRPWKADWRGATEQYWKLLTGMARSSNAFTGMSEIFRALAEKPSAFHYVSGAPQLISARPRRFLTRNGFPPGRLSLRPGLHQSTQEFKNRRIAEIAERQPSSRLLLFGDNGERDVHIFARLTDDPAFAERTEGVYVHQLYGRGVGVPLAPGQTGFLTAADLAAKLYLEGQLLEVQAEEVIRLVLDGVSSGRRTERVLAFPRPTLDTAEILDLELLAQRLAVAPRLERSFREVLGHLRSRVLEFSCGPLLALQELTVLPGD